jgi:hypothetical protein
LLMSSVRCSKNPGPRTICTPRNRARGALALDRKRLAGEDLVEHGRDAVSMNAATSRCVDGRAVAARAVVERTARGP